MALRHPAGRILIRCPNWIGDAIAATATVRCVRRNYPHAHLALLVEPYTRPVFDHAPWFDDIIVFNKTRGRIRELIRTARRLRQAPRYDLAILLTHAFSSALLVRLGRVAVRVGHAREGRACLLTDPVPWPGKGADWRLVPKVKAYAGLLEYLGCENAHDQRPQVFTSPREEAECDDLLRRHGRQPGKHLLAIVPGAAFGSSKLWPPERFALVADALAKRHAMQPLILTGPGEGRISREIARRLESSPIAFPEGAITFGHLKAMVRRSALMICNDTGPRHLGIAYGLPVVTIMGPTDPAVTASDYPKTVILRQPLPCSPCYLRVCPTDHRCMELITPDMVLEAADDLLRRFGPHLPTNPLEPPPCAPYSGSSGSNR